jgi:hypothetical protein
MGQRAPSDGASSPKGQHSMTVDRSAAERGTRVNTLDQARNTCIAPLPEGTFGNSRLGSSCGRPNRSQGLFEVLLSWVSQLAETVCVAVDC